MRAHLSYLNGDDVGDDHNHDGTTRDLAGILLGAEAGGLAGLYGTSTVRRVRRWWTWSDWSPESMSVTGGAAVVFGLRWELVRQGIGEQIKQRIGLTGGRESHTRHKAVQRSTASTYPSAMAAARARPQ